MEEIKGNNRGKNKCPHFMDNPNFGSGANCIGERGPAGPEGPRGEQGIPGTSGDCCCKDAVRYALETIYKADPTQDIQIGLFNSNVSGIIIASSDVNGDPIINDAAQLSGGFVSLCNVGYVSFENEPPQTAASAEILDVTYNCDAASACCCNASIEASLREIIYGTTEGTSPIDIIDDGVSIEIVDNTANSITPDIVYGICNGIIWVHVTSAEFGNNFLAITLCSIFSFNET